MGKITQHIIGNIGAIFAGLCCIGTPALLAALASVGLGFLINDLILLPLLLIFLGISIWGIQRSTSLHNQRAPLTLAAVSGVVILTAVWFSRPLVLLGLVGLIAASVWDVVLRKSCDQVSQQSS